MRLSWEFIRVIDFTRPRHYPNLSRKIGQVNFARCLRTDGSMQYSPPILVGDAKTKLAIEIKLGATTRKFSSNVPLFFFSSFFSCIDTIIAREYPGILAFGCALMDKRWGRDLGLGTACGPLNPSSPRTVTHSLATIYSSHWWRGQRRNKIYDVDLSHL